MSEKSYSCIMFEACHEILMIGRTDSLSGGLLTPNICSYVGIRS